MSGNGRICKPSTPGAPLNAASSQRGNKSHPSLGTSSSSCAGGAGEGGASVAGPLAAKRTAAYYYRVTMKFDGFKPTVRSTTTRAAGRILESISNQSESTWGKRLRDFAEGKISFKDFKNAMPLLKYLRVDKLDAPNEAVPDGACMVSKLPPDSTRNLSEAFKAFIPGRGPRGGGSAENDEAGKGKRTRGGRGSSPPPQSKRPRLCPPEQNARALRSRRRGALAHGDGQGHTPTSASSSAALGAANVATESDGASVATTKIVDHDSESGSGADTEEEEQAVISVVDDDSDGASVATTKIVDDDSESKSGADTEEEEQAVISVVDDDSEDDPGAGSNRPPLSREDVREMELRAAQGAVLRVMAELDRERATTKQLRAEVDQLKARLR
jgi:hypothetical protein